MAGIMVTPENLHKTGNDIKQKKVEVEEAINKGNSMIEALRGEFKGNLANQVYQKWAEILPKLRQSSQVLEEAGVLLGKVGDAFAEVDNKRI
jgi:WXG100 family type VII secretion target